MAQKKEEQTTDKKRDVKVQDLAPKKDAKGGRAIAATAVSSESAASALSRPNSESSTLQGTRPINAD